MMFFTDVRPRQIHSAGDGAATIIIYNESAVNLWVDKQEVYADQFGGIPIAAGVISNLGIWEGDLWIGADVDRSAFRIAKTKPLRIPES